MAWKHVVYPIMTHFRRRRLAELLKVYPDLDSYSVLDVGGRPFIWDLLRQYYQVAPKQLVLLNTASEDMFIEAKGYTVKIADGCQLPYADNSFDLVFSNSVIEHVGDSAQVAQFAQECDRVGHKIYIQTPNRWFPVEAHFGAAFIHWLPRPWYQKLSCLSLRYLFTYKNPIERDNFEQEFATTRLLSAHQLHKLFPKKKIVPEKVFGLTKSFVVMSLAKKASAQSIQPLFDPNSTSSSMPPVKTHRQ